MSELTSKELTAIRERAEKATEGPWKAVRDPAISGERALIVETTDPQLMFHIRGSWIPYTPERKGSLRLDAFGVLHDNAQFIAASRADVPALLAHIDALTQKLAAGPGEPSLGELEREVVEGVINLVALDDGFEGLDKEEDYFGNLADRRQQAIDELIELARPFLAARSQAVAE